MGPSIDLNLDQQPDHYEESGAEEAPERSPEETVRPEPGAEQTSVATPKSTDTEEELIPFRASKRLQGAIFRMIQLKRDETSQAISTPAPMEERTSATPLPSRKAKRQAESLSAARTAMVDIDGCKTKDTKTRPIADIVKQEGCDIVSKDVGSTGTRKRKTYAVHFAEPLVAYIEDEKETAQKLLSMSNSGRFLRSRHYYAEARVNPAAKRSATDACSNEQQQSIPPVSCFDLLCNHVGLRGWRCYRSSLEGKSFCRMHEGRKSSSLENEFFRTLHV